jgi:hypothetical protein
MDCEGKICAAGFGCFGGVCKSYCQTAANCAAIDGARQCQGTTWSTTGAPIAGVSVCRRVCDPVSPQTPRSPFLSCPAGFGCGTDTVAPGASDCRRAGTGAAGASCSATSLCAPGHTCLTTGVCARYCFVSLGGCATGTCRSFATPSFAGTLEVGSCVTDA